MLLACATDRITPPDQVFGTAALVSAPPELVYWDVTAGADLGQLFGRRGLLECFLPPLAEVYALPPVVVRRTIAVFPGLRLAS